MPSADFGCSSALCALRSAHLADLGAIPGAALAQGLIQGISGSLESTYSFFNSKTTDASGNTVKTNTQSANSRFQLDINTKIFPNLRLRTGGIAEGTWSAFDDKTNDIVTRTTVLDFRPYIDLTLETPLYTASVGYVRRQERVEVFGSPCCYSYQQRVLWNFGMETRRTAIH